MMADTEADMVICVVHIVLYNQILDIGTIQI